MSRPALALWLLGASASAPTPLLLGVDHMPMAIDDLEAAQARFRALGFTLKPGRPHNNGIRNAHAKFADGSSIELITTPAAVDPLTTEYRRLLAQGNSPAFLSLFVRDMPLTVRALAPLGVRDEDGAPGFETGPLRAFFFGTRAPSPTDRPEHFRHANGARGIDRVWLAPTDPRPVRTMIELLGGRFHARRVCLATCTTAPVAILPKGEIVLLPAHFQQLAGRPILGVSIGVDDLAKARRLIRAISSAAPLERGGGIFVPPARTNGMWIEFHAETKKPTGH